MNTVTHDTYNIKHFQLNVRVDNTLTNDPSIMVDIRAIKYEDGFIAIDVPDVPMHKLVLVKSWLQVYTDANEVAKKIFADAKTDMQVDVNGNLISKPENE